MKKKILTILLCGVIILGITGCGSNKKEEEFNPTEIDGISMTIKEGTLTKKGVTIIIKDTNGKGTYIYGTEFRIEKKENNNWIKPKETGNNCAFTQMAYYVDDDEILEFEQNWECMYGELETGNYRLVKSTSLSKDTPITYDQIKHFSVEFTIK